MAYSHQVISKCLAAAVVTCLSVGGCVPAMSPAAAKIQVVSHQAVDGCAELGEFQDYSSKGMHLSPETGRNAASVGAREKAAESGATHLVVAESKTKIFGGYSSFIGYRCSSAKL